MEKLLKESGLAFGRSLDLCLDIDLLVPSLFFLDVWPRLCRFSFFPIIEKYSLYFVFHSASDQLHDQSEFLDFRPTYVPSRGGLPRSHFGKDHAAIYFALRNTLVLLIFLLLEAISQLDDLSKKNYSVNLL